MIVIRLPSALYRYADGNQFIEVEANTVGAALVAACDIHPELSVRLLGDDGLHHPHLVIFSGETKVERSEVDSYEADGETVTILMGIVGGAHDVRMKGFRDRATVEAALVAALDGVEPLDDETVDVPRALGRVLGAAVESRVAVPGFRRATMDGFAVRSENTIGASAYTPISLVVAGESMPGRPAAEGPASGSAIRIMTGAPVPHTADSVLPAEDASEDAGRVDVRAPVAAGRNVGGIGEDVEVGETVLAAGRRLLPQDLGLLASIGAPQVQVHCRPLVRVIVSGDELLSPGEVPRGAMIADSNSPMLAGLIERDGGIVAEIVRLADGREPMREALGRTGADLIITAGAVSVGTEDHTPGLVDEMGSLLIHGIAMRPSSPTGIGRIDGRPVFLLPGNPVSCLVAYEFFAGPAIRVMGGRAAEWPHRRITAAVSGRLVSQIGRTDYARVRVVDGKVEPVAIGGASVLSSVTGADGFVVIPAGSEGYGEGVHVEVFLYGDGQ